MKKRLPRIGSGMKTCLQIIKANPGINARQVWLNRKDQRYGTGHRYTYASIDRLISQGLVSTEPGPRNSIKLFAAK